MTNGIAWLFDVTREHLGSEKGYMWTLLVGQVKKLATVLESSVILTPRNQCSCWLYIQNVARISLLLTTALLPLLCDCWSSHSRVLLQPPSGSPCFCVVPCSLNTAARGFLVKTQVSPCFFSARKLPMALLPPSTHKSFQCPPRPPGSPCVTSSLTPHQIKH